MNYLVLLLFVFWTVYSWILTFNVLKPLKNRDTSSPLGLLCGFGFGWLVGDLAPQWISFNLGIFLLIYSFQCIDSIILTTVFLFHFPGWLLLFLRLWLILDLPDRLEQQMLVQLGQSFSETKSIIKSPRFFSEVDWRIWWWPTCIYRNPLLKINFNYEYDAAPGLKLQLDIYQSSESGENRPILIQIHGGGWVVGSRRQASTLLTRMASHGWVCFSIGYRMSPEIEMPEHLIDCKRALHWIRSHAEEFSINSEKVFVTGCSAGAQLAMMMALTPNRAEFQPGFEEGNTLVQGCVGFYGVYDLHSAFNDPAVQKARAKLFKLVVGGTPNELPERFRMVSPFHWEADSLPPSLLIQGGSDTLIPMSEAERMHYRNLKESLNPQTLLRVPLAEHAFDIFPSLTAQCIIPFAERYLILQNDILLQTKTL